ncbi:uncharacterized protein LOC120219110 [Hibiscus syriacus]|uniref:uncharacterized protein LOC120219110 n=1 Tax=Hibiscus syriacus TaxID=106335 RepID=UPI0019236B14|nr:uncharacterized protein LOC120219110 [Hibiscus syriacus]
MGSPSQSVDEASTPRQCHQLIAILTSQLQATSREFVSFVIASMQEKTVVSVSFADNIWLSSKFILRDLMYVPEFRFNLLSVGCLMNNADLNVLFCKSKCLIQDLCQVIGKVELLQGLYLLQIPFVENLVDNNYVSYKDFSNTSLVSWHEILGHPSSSVLHLLKDVLPFNFQNNKIPYSVCPLAKQRRFPFQFSCVETPQQNSVVKRKHQHLLTVAKTLFFQSKVHRDKFSERALPVVFLGYSPGVKGYKVLIVRSMKIVISHNVVFHENVFPFYTINDVVIDPFDIVLSNVSDDSTNEAYESYAHADLICASQNSSHEQTEGVNVEHVPGEIDEVIPEVPQHLSFSKLSPENGTFVANISCHSEPLCYHQVVRSPVWHAAMEEELQAMEDLKTWTVVTLLEGKKAIDCKWASRKWFTTFSKVDLQLGFTQSPVEHSLFIKGSSDRFMSRLVYVDDIVLAGKNMILLDEYALELLTDTGCLGKKPVECPMVSIVKLNATDGQLVLNPQLYRRLVGLLLYLTHIRPDIAHMVHVISQFVSSPRVPHMQALQHLLAYIKQSLVLVFSFHKNLTCSYVVLWIPTMVLVQTLEGPLLVVAHSLVTALFHEKQRKQVTVSRSSCEAEYRAMVYSTCELIWLAPLLSSFNIPVQTASLYCDNQAAMHLATNQLFLERTKHIEVDCHFVRQKVTSDFLKLLHVRSSHQLADIFTQTLRSPAYKSFITKMGLIDIHVAPT